MQSKEMTDVYSTQEPQQQFHKRIQFCLDLHNELVKVCAYCIELDVYGLSNKVRQQAMRYKPGQKKELESEEARKARKEEEEVVTALEDEMDEEDFF